MAHFLSKFRRGRGPNLVAAHSAYDEIARLLRGTPVHGIIDAGASDGRVARRFLERFSDATVYAFEPQPRYTEALDRFAAKQPRFRPFQLALLDKPGQIELNITENAGQTSVFSATDRPGAHDRETSPVAQTLSVPAVRLDDWAREQGDVSIELMKFDIQAAELMALRGAEGLLGSSVKLVYAEVFFNPWYEGGALFGEIDALLRGHGFVLHNFYKPSTDHGDRLLWANAIFIKPDAVDAAAHATH